MRSLSSFRHRLAYLSLLCFQPLWLGCCSFCFSVCAFSNSIQGALFLVDSSPSYARVFCGFISYVTTMAAVPAHRNAKPAR